MKKSVCLAKHECCLYALMLVCVRIYQTQLLRILYSRSYRDRCQKNIRMHTSVHIHMRTQLYKHFDDLRKKKFIASFAALTSLNSFRQIALRHVTLDANYVFVGLVFALSRSSRSQCSRAHCGYKAPDSVARLFLLDAFFLFCYTS